MKKAIAIVILLVVAIPWFMKQRSFYTTEPGNNSEPGIAVRFHCAVFEGQEILIKYPGAQIHNMRIKENRNISLESDPGTNLVRSPQQSDEPRASNIVTEVSGQATALMQSRQTLPGSVPVTVQAYKTTSTTTTEDGVLVTATPRGAIATQTVEVAGKTHMLEVRWQNRAVTSVTLDSKSLKRARLGSFLGIPILGTQ